MTERAESQNSKRAKTAAEGEADDQFIDFSSFFTPEVTVTLPDLSLDWDEYQV